MKKTAPASACAASGTNAPSSPLVDLSRQELSQLLDDWYYEGQYSLHSPRTTEFRRHTCSKLIWFLQQQNRSHCETMDLRQFLAYAIAWVCASLSACPQTLRCERRGACALSSAQWKLRFPVELKTLRIGEGAAGIPAIQEALNLMARAHCAVANRTSVGVARFDQAGRRANSRGKRGASQSHGDAAVERSAVERSMDAARMESSARRSADGSEHLPAKRTLHVGQRAQRRYIVQRVNEVLPFLNGKNCRLLDVPSSRAWIGQLLALPSGAHDDAVQSTIGGMMPFVQGSPDLRQRVITRERLESVLIR